MVTTARYEGEKKIPAMTFVSSFRFSAYDLAITGRMAVKSTRRTVAA